MASELKIGIYKDLGLERGLVLGNEVEVGKLKQ